jgi:hypothetical protein
MTALQWIVKEAKAQKNKYPTKFKTWKEYIKQASKQYNTGIKPSFPKKNKVGAVKKKAAPKKKVGATDPNKAFKKQMQVNKIINTKYKNWEYPVTPVYTGNWSTINCSNWIKKNGRKIGAIKRKVVKKKAAPKKKAAKKKIGYSKVRLDQEKGITKVLKNTPRTLFPYTAKEKIVKAGKKYFDEQSKKISGLNNNIIKKLQTAMDDYNMAESQIMLHRSNLKNGLKDPFVKKLNQDIVKQNIKLKKEFSTHIKELKKLI